jgi:hypothetical protein
MVWTNILAYLAPNSNHRDELYSCIWHLCRVSLFVIIALWLFKQKFDYSAKDKHSSLFCPIASDEEKKV